MVLYDLKACRNHMDPCEEQLLNKNPLSLISRLNPSKDYDKPFF